MNRYKIILHFLFCFTLSQVNAQQSEIQKEFVIIHSTRDYNAALQTVNEASKKLDLKIDLRGLYPNEEYGLKTDSVCGCGEIHDYVPRGRWDDGSYISIEYSNNYEGFTKGYYIVIIASAVKGSEQLTEILKNAKTHYVDSYVKNAPIYIGCMH